jgi:hypothetical protein
MPAQPANHKAAILKTPSPVLQQSIGGMCQSARNSLPGTAEVHNSRLCTSQNLASFDPLQPQKASSVSVLSCDCHSTISFRASAVM